MERFNEVRVENVKFLKDFYHILILKSYWAPFLSPTLRQNILFSLDLDIQRLLLTSKFKVYIYIMWLLNHEINSKNLDKTY